MTQFQIISTPDIGFVLSDNKDTLATAFLRMQEFYSSSNERFRAKVFQIYEFSSWYQETYSREYREDWRGFCIPSFVVEVFAHGLFDPLLGPEESLLAVIADNFKKTPQFIVGALIGNNEDLRINWSVALWKTNAKYQRLCEAVIASHAAQLAPAYEYFKERQSPEHLVNVSLVAACIANPIVSLSEALQHLKIPPELPLELFKIFLQLAKPKTSHPLLVDAMRQIDA